MVFSFFASPIFFAKWQKHLSKTWKDMKKLDPDCTYKDAIKAAKETYVKPKKSKK